MFVPGSSSSRCSGETASFAGGGPGSKLYLRAREIHSRGVGPVSVDSAVPARAFYLDCVLGYEFAAVAVFSPLGELFDLSQGVSRVGIYGAFCWYISRLCNL